MLYLPGLTFIPDTKGSGTCVSLSLSEVARQEHTSCKLHPFCHYEMYAFVSTAYVHIQGTNKSYAPSPVSKSISQPQTPAPSEHRRIANESPHLLPPKPKSLVKMDHRPHSTPLTSNELRIQTANFPQPGSSSQAPPSQEHPPHLRLRSNTQPTPSKLPAIIDLTGEDDEDVPVVQLVPRKRTREHDQEMSDSLASLKARGSVSGSRSVPPVPSPPPTEAPSSASSFSNDSQVGQPTEAEILYVCLQNAYEQWKDSMNQVSCVMCKYVYNV